MILGTTKEKFEEEKRFWKIRAQQEEEREKAIASEARSKALDEAAEVAGKMKGYSCIKEKK